MPDQLDEALRLIERHPDEADFAGPRTEQSIAAGEAVLGLRFPEKYRRFLRHLGCGSFGGAEFYGICEDDPTFEGPVPDAVWLTLRERAGGSIPDTVVIVGDDGMGGYYGLDTAQGPEPSVLIWSGSSTDRDALVEEVAPDFGTFVLNVVRSELDEQQR